MLIDFVTGDTTGLSIPAHPDALAMAGPRFLTTAFRKFGILPKGNRVVRVTRSEQSRIGSTGQKLRLWVEYAQESPRLHTELFVKFSRDFNDAIRDRGRYELESEVRFAALSRSVAFPIAVPRPYFADYHRESGTGLLITSSVPFGRDGIEPPRTKCMDHELDDPLPYYGAIIRALARLAAAHRSGELSTAVEQAFPFDAVQAAMADRIAWNAAELRAKIKAFADLSQVAPQLFPDSLVGPEFIRRFEQEALEFLRHENIVTRYLNANADYIALCHWNANIDNAWFWRDDAGTLQCGLLDWGRVRQLNLSYALWGALCGAPIEFWDRHFDPLLELFIDELRRCGGPQLDSDELRRQLWLYVAIMGLGGLIVAPERINLRIPDVARVSGPRDPALQKVAQARNFLHIFTLFLHLWRTRDFRGALEYLVRSQDHV